MASSWRDYRRMTCGDRQFCWRVSFDHPAEVNSMAYARQGHSWPPDRLLIRPSNQPDRLLTVCWPACRSPVVVPKIVRASITEAIRRQWPDVLPRLELPGSEVITP